MPVHEGKILRKLLKDRGIGVNKISEKFEVSRTAVYQYFDSASLSDQIKDRFSKHFGIHISDSISDVQGEDSSHLISSKVTDEDIFRLTKEIEYQRRINDEMQKRIDAQEATINAQQKLINFLSIKKDLDIKLGKEDKEPPSR